MIIFWSKHQPVGLRGMPINPLGLGGSSGSAQFILGGGIGGLDLLISMLGGGDVGRTPP